MEKVKVNDLFYGKNKFCMRDSLLQDVAQAMSEMNCSAIPVVDSITSLRPIGIISERDILSQTVAMGFNPIEFRVSDCMNNDFITVYENVPLVDALKIMEQRQVDRLVVVDEEGGSVGVLSQSDIALHNIDSKFAKLVRNISIPFFSNQKKSA